MKGRFQSPQPTRQLGVSFHSRQVRRAASFLVGTDETDRPPFMGRAHPLNDLAVSPLGRFVHYRMAIGVDLKNVAPDGMQPSHNIQATHPLGCPQNGVATKGIRRVNVAAAGMKVLHDI